MFNTSDWLTLVVTILIAAAGSYIGWRLRIPAGGLVGAVLAVGVFQACTGLAWMPVKVKTFSSSITGAYLGARVTREDVASLRRIPLAAATMLGSMLAYNVLCGVVLSHWGGVDLATGLFATAPGGITEISLAAMDMGANAAVVTSIQMIRLLAVVLLTPPMLRLVLAKKAAAHADEAAMAAEVTVQAPAKHKGTMQEFLLTLAIGICAGVVGKLLRIPAGALCFSMIACTLYNMKTGRGYLPMPVRRVAQCCNGAIIGMRFLAKDLLVIRGMLLPVAAVTFGWLLLNLLLGWVLHRFGKLSVETALFASAAGGMSDMGLLSAEFGANTTQVSVLQLCRVISIIAISPMLVSLFG